MPQHNLALPNKYLKKKKDYNPDTHKGMTATWKPLWEASEGASHADMILDFQPPHCEMINVYCLSCPISGALLQQTKQTWFPKFGNQSIEEKLESTGKGMTLDGPGNGTKYLWTESKDVLTLT